MILDRGSPREVIVVAMEIASGDYERLAGCIANSKRVKWDIDTDVIGDRKLDFADQFLPGGGGLLVRFRSKRLRVRGAEQDRADTRATNT